MSEIQISAKDGGRFMAYHAAPKSGTGPGLVLIQEIFGVNKVMRDLADIYAVKGYHAVVPDLFWRQEPGIQLTDKSEAEWGRATAFVCIGQTCSLPVTEPAALAQLLRGDQTP